jgi:2',3'-cyclic-nucleotide 2'-phosphodiesterase (5'-nucleotidase family)
VPGARGCGVGAQHPRFSDPIDIALPTGEHVKNKESNVTQVLRSGRIRTSFVVLIAVLTMLALAAPGIANPGRGEGRGPVGNPTPGPQHTFELTILHINDGESALLPSDSDPGVARFVADLKALQDAGNRLDRLPPQASQRARDIQAHRNPRATITISSGDNYLAGPQLNASLSDPDAFYDALVYMEGGFDAITIGNHEFDFGPDVLADFIEATEYIPFISANLDFSGEPRLAALEAQGRIAGSTVVEKAGRQIGVVGATYENLASISSPRNVTTTPAAEAVQAEIDMLTADGVDIIILSSHLQSLDTDLELLEQLSGVDAAIAGGGVERLDPFPTYATDADGNDVPVVTTVGNYRDIGQLVLRFDRDGNVTQVVEQRSDLIPVPLEGPRDPFIAENVEAPVTDYVADLVANVLATTEVWLDGANPPVRFRETNVGDLFADALLFAARARADTFGVGQADVALQNSGGIRNNIRLEPGDELTEFLAFEMAAFSNFVSISQVDGQKLKDVLEHSVSSLPATGNGRFGQWSGVEFVYDPSLPAQTFVPETNEILERGTRIREAVVTRANGERVTLVSGGTLVAPDATFWFVTNDFTFRGGDDYPLDDLDFTTMGITYQQALAERVSSLGTITAVDYPDLTVNADTYRRFGPVGSFAISP